MKALSWAVFSYARNASVIRSYFSLPIFIQFQRRSEFFRHQCFDLDDRPRRRAVHGNQSTSTAPKTMTSFDKFSCWVLLGSSAPRPRRQCDRVGTSTTNERRPREHSDRQESGCTENASVSTAEKESESKLPAPDLRPYVFIRSGSESFQSRPHRRHREPAPRVMTPKYSRARAL